MSWTPGKMSMSAKDWAHLNDPKQTQTIVQDGVDVIACVWADEEADEARCARLIAAAPSMYADLQRDLSFAKNVVAYLKATGDTKDVLFTSAEMRVKAIRAALRTVDTEGRS